MSSASGSAPLLAQVNSSAIIGRSPPEGPRSSSTLKFTGFHQKEHNMRRCFCSSVVFAFCALLSCCWLEQSSAGGQAAGSSMSNHSFGVRQREILAFQARNQTETLPRFKRKSRTAPQLPEFSAPIGNITAVQGRDVRLVCTIEHLGQYQVSTRFTPIGR